MRVAKQTPTLLVIKAGAKTKLLAFGLIVLVAGLLAVTLVRIRPITPEEASLPDLLESQQQVPSAESGIQTSSPAGYGGLSFVHYVGQLLFTEQRPVVPLGVLGIIVGLLIVVGPHYNQSLILDKTRQQVILKEPRSFFRSKIETYSFEDIAEVRVVRDRSATGKTDRNYRVDLVINHSEGIPLTPNYIHYVEVFPLSQAYKYGQKEAQTIVDRIQTFLKETKV